MSSSSSSQLPPGYCDRNAAGNATLIVNIVTLSLATIFLFTRTYMRLRILHCFWWDDVCLILAYIMMVPAFVGIFLMIHWGLGRHEECYSAKSLSRAVEAQYIIEFLLMMSSVLSRTSVALFVGCLFAVTKPFKVALYAWTIFMILSLVTCACLEWAYCSPVKALWVPVEGANCWSTYSINIVDYYDGAVSIASDMLLALLPIYFLIGLRISNHQRFALIALLGLGIIPGVCSIARTLLLPRQQGPDPLYNTAVLSVMASVEISMLIICAALSAICPALISLQKHRRRLVKSGSTKCSSKKTDSISYSMRARKIFGPLSLAITRTHTETTSPQT